MLDLPSWAELISWLYKWLPIIFGCHCRDDRSFHYKGKKFPICARCTGELVGILGGILLGIFFLPRVWVAVACMIPMLADGFIQLLTPYQSTNMRRLVTGTLFGYALYSLIAISTVAAFHYGYNLALHL